MSTFSPQLVLHSNNEHQDEYDATEKHPDDSNSINPSLWLPSWGGAARFCIGVGSMEVVGGFGFRLVMPRSVINAEVRLMEKLERDDDGSGELVAVDVAVGESNRVSWEVQIGWGVCTG